MLPPVLADANMLSNWMNAFFETLRRPSLHAYVPDPDDLLYEPESKTKKWISQILVKFLKRYGSPHRIPIDEPWSKKVAENFRDNHAEKATKVMLEVLFSETNGYQVSKRVAHIALDYVEEAIETASLWAVVYPHVSNLLTRVVFSYLCFSDADEEVWMGDPSEYVRKQYDFTDDFTSPRMAASNLLSKMADLRSKKTVLPFLQYLHDAVLNPFLTAAPNSPQRLNLSRQKVGAFAALAAVKGKLMSKPELSSTFLMILKKHVHPDLQSEFGFLRSEAAWLLGQVASCEWQEFGSELGEASLRGCVALLSDRELPVQAAAAGALQYLIDQDGPEELIRTFAPQLMQRLLGLMDNMTDSYLSLIPSLDKLIVRYPDEIMPLAHPVLQRLIAAFKHSAQSILADGDDEDDELAFTAAQVLYLISSVLSSVGEWSRPKLEEKKELLLSIEKELQPLLERMFEENHQVFVEELLDVLGALIVQLGEHQVELTPFLRAMIGKMAKAFNEWAGDYVEQMMDAIEGYLMYDMPAIAHMQNGISTFVHIIRNLWSSAYDDGDAVFGTMIAEYLLLNLEKISPRPTEMLRGVAIEIAMRAGERCVRTRDDEINLPQRLFSVVMLCMYIDAEHVLKALSVQSTLQLIGSQTGKLQLFERIHSKKAIILGLASMLSTSGLVGEEQKAQLLHIAVCLQQMIDTQRVTAANNAANAGNSFAALSKGAATNGFGYHSTSDDNGSDLEDDQDATNVLDDTPEPYNETIEKLAAETGFSVAQLHELSTSNGAIDIGLFDIDEGHDRDDEGGYRASPIDDINEGEYLVNRVKQSSFETWWSKVSEEDRLWMEQLAKRQHS
ncbi:Armadillo-like helical domain containing protein [Gracilaria domingensis]|nr:Armadillo-like helical domain containing protein [Gracilaria domingensis]